MKIKKTIRVKFVDFLNGSKLMNLITNILEDHYNVEISDSPEYLFYSSLNGGCTHYEYPQSIKIYCVNEIASPDFNECDYAIGPEPIIFEKRYCTIEKNFYYDYNEINDRSKFTSTDLVNRDFCSFIYNNTSSG